MLEHGSRAADGLRPQLSAADMEARCSVAYCRAVLAALATLSRQAREAIDGALNDEIAFLAEDESAEAQVTREMITETRDELRDRLESKAGAKRILEKALIDMAAKLPDGLELGGGDTMALRKCG